MSAAVTAPTTRTAITDPDLAQVIQNMLCELTMAQAYFQMLAKNQIAASDRETMCQRRNGFIQEAINEFHQQFEIAPEAAKIV